MKRFTDTDIWKKQWFQDLEPKNKIIWFYLKDVCDSVGVWSVNKRLAEFQIGAKVDWDKFLKACNGNIIIIAENKWWLKDFCSFQYGELSEESTSKPIISYIKQLKKHNLWKGYVKGIQEGMVALQEKEKEKDKDKDKDKEKDRKEIKHKYGEYQHVLLTAKQYESLKSKVDNVDKWINTIDESIQEKGNIYHIKDFNLAIQKWYKRSLSSSTAKDFNEDAIIGSF